MILQAENLRISPLVDDYYDDIPYHLLDHSRMLKREIALEKEVTFEKNGRPKLASLSYKGVEYAQLGYLATTDEENFLMTREYVIRYWVTGVDGGEDYLSDPITIKKESLTSDKKAYKRVAEREGSRKYILQDMKVMVLGVLKTALGLTTVQVIEMTDSFWRDFDLDIKYFVRNGAETWRNRLMNEDLSKYMATETVNWLTDVPNPFGEGVIKDYIIDRLDI